MVKDRYGIQREVLAQYAKDVGGEAPEWNQAGDRLKTAEVESIAFTSYGIGIYSAYEKLVNDYAWNAWRVGMTLRRIEQILENTRQNYGKAEAIVTDKITNVGERI